MMIESLRDDLDCHRGAPDKVPARRLATLEAAGRLQIPFTTGILVGIGETTGDRIDALEAIAASHARHGHVQEVIVQNFLPKAGTAMHGAPPCPADDFLQAIALARLILPPEIHLQAPTEPVRRLRHAARRGHRRLGRRLAGHRRPREPRAARGRRSTGCARSPRPRASRWPRASPSTPSTRSTPTVGSTRHLASPCSIAATPRGSGATIPAPCSPSGSRPPSTPAPAPTSCRSVAATRRGTPARRWSRPHSCPASGSGGWHGPVGEVLEGVLLGQEVGEDEITTLFSRPGP